jgi:hypothetical protein
MWGKMTIHTMYLNAAGIVIMGGALPGFRGMGMNMAGFTVFIGGCFDYCFVSQEYNKGCNQHAGKEN